MNCPQCDAPIVGKLGFCSECGAELPRGEATRPCSRCGTQMEAWAAFCPECGEQAGGARLESKRERVAELRARVEAAMREPAKPAPKPAAKAGEGRKEPAAGADRAGKPAAKAGPAERPQPETGGKPGLRPEATGPARAAADSDVKTPPRPPAERPTMVVDGAVKPFGAAEGHPGMATGVHRPAMGSTSAPQAEYRRARRLAPEPAGRRAIGLPGGRLSRVLVLVLLLAAVTLVVTLFVGAERVGLELAGLSGILTRGGSSPATVPAPTATPEATEVPTTAPSATPEPTETPTLEPTPEPADTSPEPTPVPLVHTVRFGETLRSIATQYGVTAEEIMEANGLSSDAIRAEQELVIPGRFESTPTAQARGPSVHIVQQGENLILIAQKYRVGVADLMAANNLASADLIRVGQTLQIPGAGTPPAPGPTEAPLATATPLLPTATLVATVMMTPTPAPQPTPSHEFAAPNLLTPAMGAVVKGAEDVLLNWTSVGLLADDTWYVIKIWRDDPSLPTPSTGWTRTTAWRILASFQPGAGETSRRFYWSVTVMRAREGQAPVAVSPASEERWFEWE